MKADRISATELLNEATETVARTATPWLGVLWIASLPARFMQVYYFWQLSILDENAHRYGYFLFELSLLTMCFWLLQLVGRLVYVRACFMAQHSTRSSGLEPLRVNRAEILTYFFTALTLEVLFYILFITFVCTPFLIILMGLAVATAYGQENIELVSPFRNVLKFVSQPRVLLINLLFLSIAALVTWVNLYMLVRFCLWTISSMGGAEISTLEYLFRPDTYIGIVPMERISRLLLLAGASLAIEPFWLATHALFVHKHRARDKGDDLRNWHASLRHAEETAV